MKISTSHGIQHLIGFGSAIFELESCGWNWRFVGRRRGGIPNFRPVAVDLRPVENDTEPDYCRFNVSTWSTREDLRVY